MRRELRMFVQELTLTSTRSTSVFRVHSAHESNFSSFIQSTSLNGGIDPARLPHYCFLGETVCGELGIKVERGFPYPRPGARDFRSSASRDARNED